MSDTAQTSSHSPSPAVTPPPETGSAAKGNATADEGKEVEATDSPVEPTEAETEETKQPATTPWQAVWSPQYNAYYFYNSETQETTWVNPLASPEASTSESSSDKDSQIPADQTPPTAVTPAYSALQAAAIAQGIDPSLAYLDPSLASSPSGGPSTYPSFTAKFNSRTGAFARPDARDPSHLSEYDRAKRMSEFYFDVNAWEKDVEENKRKEAQGEGKKRKRPSKNDLERFKEQKKQKKIAKTAWLRT